MTEIEAVKRSLLMAGFTNGGQHFFFEDTDKTCYIPTSMITNFDQVIDYMKAFSFHRFCTKEERMVYYRTAKKLRNLKVKFNTTQVLE